MQGTHRRYEADRGLLLTNLTYCLLQGFNGLDDLSCGGRHAEARSPKKSLFYGEGPPSLTRNAGRSGEKGCSQNLIAWTRISKC